MEYLDQSEFAHLQNILQMTFMKSKPRSPQNVISVNVLSDICPKEIDYILKFFINLQTLKLTVNNLLWSSILNMPKLQHLQLTLVNRNYPQSHLSILTKLVALKSISIRGCVDHLGEDPLSKMLSYLTQLKHLEKIKIISQLRSYQTKNIDLYLAIHNLEGHFQPLRILHLKNVRLLSFKPEQTQSILGQLEEIWLEECNVEMELLHEMAMFMKNLRAFKFTSYFGINQPILKLLKRLPNLSKLWISQYEKESEEDSSFEECISEYHSNLTQLAVDGYSGAEGNVKVLIKNLNNLESISFLPRQYNRFSLVEMHIFQFTLSPAMVQTMINYLPGLLKLELQCKLSDQCLRLISTGFKYLKTFKLSPAVDYIAQYQSVTSKGIFYLGKLKEIQFLRISALQERCAKVMIKVLRNQRKLKQGYLDSKDQEEVQSIKDHRNINLLLKIAQEKYLD